MPPKQRQIRIEQRAGLAAMQQLESRSDEELERETRHKAAAMAILGARAADRYDAKAGRSYFQRALAAARPQERMQLKRMADASLALAERRVNYRGSVQGFLARAADEVPGHRAPRFRHHSSSSWAICCARSAAQVSRLSASVRCISESVRNSRT